jgi:hypothetical protein
MRFIKLLPILTIFLIVFSLAVYADTVTQQSSTYHSTPRIDGLVLLADADPWTIGLWLGEFDAKNNFPKDPQYAISLTQRMDLQNDLEQIYLKLTSPTNKGTYLQAYRLGYERGDWMLDVSKIKKSALSPEVQAAVATKGFSSSYDYGYMKGYQDVAANNAFDDIGYYNYIQEQGVLKPHMVRIAYTIQREYSEFYNGYRNGYYSYSPSITTTIVEEEYNLAEDNPEIVYVRELLPYADLDHYTIGTVAGWSDAKVGNNKRKTYMLDELNKARTDSKEYLTFYSYLIGETGDYYKGYSDGYALALE